MLLIGTRFPVVIHGPEGCGKSAWLRQVAVVLKKQDFDVIYVDVAHKEYIAYTDVREVIDKISEVIADITGYTPIKLADLIILLANQLLKSEGRRELLYSLTRFFKLLELIKQKYM